jgi:hypothetical protein
MPNRKKDFYFVDLIDNSIQNIGASWQEHHTCLIPTR